MLPGLTGTILRSYRHWFGRELIPLGHDPLQRAQALFLAPFVVAASNADVDPLLVYGNQKALDLWELTWEQFIRMPARKTAEPMEQAERTQFLARVRQNGFVNDYSGVRISSGGRRFRIRQATVWNLLDPAGKYYGQAVVFDHWDYLEQHLESKEVHHP